MGIQHRRPLQDVFDPEAKSIADLSDYCASRDSAYYDGRIIKASRPLVSNSTDMLYSEGRRTEYPGFVFGLRPQTGAVAHHRRHQLPLEGIRQDEDPPTRPKNCSEALS